MDKNNFISLLNHYSRSSVSEALEILALKQKYPYSQILHALSAKVSKDHGFSTQQQELQLAAVYAADRSVLKEVISALHEIESTSNYQQSTGELAKGSINKIEIEVPTYTTPEINSSVDLADALIEDLKQLNKSRRDFEQMFDNSGKTNDEKSPESSTPETQINPIEFEGDQTKTGKSKKERIIELARAKAFDSATSISEEKQSGSKKKVNTGNILIDEIASSKKEINPETEKQKAQIQIIDQFIKAQPIIANTKDKPITEPADLSTIKSGEFGDNIVSETLVDILLKQGKKDKAIEVLKKLIWKFPQKKAYFAAQIEELKK